MKNFLRFILIEPFESNDWIGYLLGVVLWLFVLVILVLFVWLIVWFVDSSFLSLKEEQGIITNKYYIQEHTVTTYVPCNKIMIPQIVPISASYEVEITIDGLKDNISISESCWNNISIGNKVYCSYTNGRILKSLYIKSFRLID